METPPPRSTAKEPRSRHRRTVALGSTSNLLNSVTARKLARQAVEFFVGQGLLAEGEYSLAIVRDGKAAILSER